jgi:hypothetical protein
VTKAEDKLADLFVDHTLCRPPREAAPVKSDYANKTELWRLGTDGKWRPDNKQPGLAFVGARGDDVVVWSSACKCKFPNGCSAGAGSDFAFSKLDLPTLQFERRRPMAGAVKASRATLRAKAKKR